MEKYNVKIYVKGIAERRGWELNKDEEIVDLIVDGLYENYKKWGKLGCPCMIFRNQEMVTKDKCCPCFQSRNDVENKGTCHCMLYCKHNEI